VSADYEFHPLANIFPLIEGQAYSDLMADVQRNGVLSPVWLYDGKILDGRNRYRAARAMGVKFETRDYIGIDPASFVVSLNLHRRHLTESQRAAVAVKLANRRRRPSGRLRGRCANLRTCHAGPSRRRPERLAPQRPGRRQGAAPGRPSPRPGRGARRGCRHTMLVQNSRTGRYRPILLKNSASPARCASARVPRPFPRSRSSILDRSERSNFLGPAVRSFKSSFSTESARSSRSRHRLGADKLHASPWRRVHVTSNPGRHASRRGS